MIIFQHFDNDFELIKEIIYPFNAEYCKKFNISYKYFTGDFEDYFSESGGLEKKYWVKILLIQNLLNIIDHEWIFMLDGDILLNSKNNIALISHMMRPEKHIALCRVSNDLKEFWKINSGAILIRNSDISRNIIRNMLDIGKNINYKYNDQIILQEMIKNNNSNIEEYLEVFPSIAFNHNGGPFLFHPCGAGYTTTGYNKKLAIENKYKILQEKIRNTK